MKTKSRKQMAGIATLLAMGTALAQAYDPSWTKAQCDTYSYHGLGERYVFGGDKGWIDNNSWDSSTTEGVDCSSYVPRCWAIEGAGQTYLGEHTAGGHPYHTGMFYDNTIANVLSTSLSSLAVWDCWVYRVSGGGPSDHMGLAKSIDGSNVYTREARGSAYGVMSVTRSKATLTDWGARYRKRKDWGAGNNPGTPSRIDVFVRATDNSIRWQRWEQSTGWVPGMSSYTSIGGNAASDPTSASWGPGRIDVFYRGSDNNLYQRYYANGAWNSQGWTSKGACPTGTTGSPDVCSWGPGRLDVFVRGANGTLHHKWHDGGTWENWQQLNNNMQMASDPSAVCWGPDRIDVFALGTAGNLIHMWWDGDTWHDWQSLGGSGLVGAPDACSYEPRRMDIFIRDTSNAMRQKYFDGTTWSASFANLGTSLVSDPGACSFGVRRIDVFARGGNNQLYQRYFDGNWNPGWNTHGGTLLGGVDTTSWSNTAGDR